MPSSKSLGASVEPATSSAAAVVLCWYGEKFMFAPPFSDSFLFLSYRFRQIEFVWILLFHKLDERINLGRTQRFQVNRIIIRKGWRRVEVRIERRMKEVRIIVWAIICDQEGNLWVQLNVKLIIYTMNYSAQIKWRIIINLSSAVAIQGSRSCFVAPSRKLFIQFSWKA